MLALHRSGVAAGKNLHSLSWETHPGQEARGLSCWHTSMDLPHVYKDPKICYLENRSAACRSWKIWGHMWVRLPDSGRFSIRHSRERSLLLTMRVSRGRPGSALDCLCVCVWVWELVCVCCVFISTILEMSPGQSSHEILTSVSQSCSRDSAHGPVSCQTGSPKCLRVWPGATDTSAWASGYI